MYWKKTQNQQRNKANLNFGFITNIFKKAKTLLWAFPNYKTQILKNFPYILYTVWKKEKRIKKETKRKWEKHWGVDGSTVKRLKEAVMWFLVRVSVQI